MMSSEIAANDLVIEIPSALSSASLFCVEGIS